MSQWAVVAIGKLSQGPFVVLGQLSPGGVVQGEAFAMESCPGGDVGPAFCLNN